MLFVIISLLASIASIVCWILVLTKLFPTKGILWGIFGVLCGIYAFIWGWQNVERFDFKKIMMIWSVSIVINIISNTISTSMSQ